MGERIISEIIEADTGFNVIVTWLSCDNQPLCSGSATVSRDPDAYVPILAADIRAKNQELFIEEVQENGLSETV